MKNHDQNECSLLYVINVLIKQQSCKEGRKSAGSREPWEAFKKSNERIPGSSGGRWRLDSREKGEKLESRDQSEGHLHLIQGRDEKSS